MKVVGIATELLNEKFKSPDFADCFIVEIEFDQVKNKLAVFLDADESISLSRCQKLSRHLESHFDENMLLGAKYTLEVSSAGLDRPLKFLRQYQKNIGRTLRVWLTDNTKTEGKLAAADASKITITREVKKKIEKKNKIVTETQEINFSDISKSKVIPTF